FFEKPDFAAFELLGSMSSENILAVDILKREYVLIEMKTHESRNLDNLNGMEFWSNRLNLPAGTPQDWAYFVDSQMNPGTRVMKAVNLDSGKIFETLTLNEDQVIHTWDFAFNFPSEGSSSFLVRGIDNYAYRAWAINSDAGLALALEGEDGDIAPGGISQNGRWGVYSVNGSKADKSVVVIDMKTGKTRTIASGTSPVWLVD
ncbi:MAG: hypothetical protein MUO40_08305, partial [Anaerolineaceae bacterium]|nr:hypothetical protein [Anaerolineaceae bacterium]